MVTQKERTLKERTVSGLLWGGVNNLFLQGVGIITGIVLARLLSQSDYGMVAMISVVGLVAIALQNSGFTVALTNLTAPEHKDYNAVFWCNLLVGGSLYVVLFFLSPFLALFYDDPRLVPLCRYAFLNVVIAAFGTAQNAWLFKHLRARQQAQGAMLAVVVSSVVAIVMAARGMAYWSLATQNLVYIFVYTLCAWHYSSWRPTVRGLSLRPALALLRFSCKILATSLLTIINNNVLNILLGRLLGAAPTGVYHQAYQWNNKASSVVQNMVNQVAQPVLVDMRGDACRQLNALRHLLRFTAFISCPLLIGLALVAKEFIVVALTAKWLSSASLLQIMCAAGAVAPLSALLANMVISKGLSGQYLASTAALFAVQLVVVLLFAGRGLTVMVGAYTSTNVLWLFVWHALVWRQTGYTLWQLVCDVAPYACTAGACALVAVVLTLSLSTLWLLLLVKCILFAVLYYAVLKVLRMPILAESEAFLKQRLRR